MFLTQPISLHKIPSARKQTRAVSLDKNHDKWVEAIGKDKLAWTHVSDLKYWDNEAAKLYGVRAIPANFLLDKEGKIFARNLSGDELMKKLSEVVK